MEISITNMVNTEVEQSIEDQYEQGTGPEVTDMEVPQGQQPMTPEQAYDFLDGTLPLMRLQGEYDKLMIEQLTNDALLGRRPIAQIPGLLGLELKRREIEVQQYLGAYTGRLSDELQAAKEKEVLQKQEALKTGIQSQLIYTGDNAGQIQAFVTGVPIEEATEFTLDPSNVEKRVTISVADSNYKTGRRELVFLPTDIVVKCGDGTMWSMKDSKLNTAN